MLSCLLLFVAVAFFIRLPFFILRVLFRFSKPLALVGIGCALGVTFSTGYPENSEIDPLAAIPSAHTSDLKDVSDLTAPKLIEAALDLAQRAEESLSTAIGEVQTAWDKSGEKKVESVRKSAVHDYKALSSSLWERRKKST